VKTLSFPGLIIGLGLITLTSCSNNKPKTVESGLAESNGVAVVITGAAAKVTQEAALLETLYMRGDLDSVAFISGASSGSLNSVALNAILTGKYSWARYHALMAGLTNSDIFIQDDHKLPVSTDPLRQLLKQIVNDSLGYYKMSDLPIPTSFSIVSLKPIADADRSFRMSNVRINSESDPDLDIVDVLMASIAFPVVFPPVKIPGAHTLPEGLFIDGGVGSDHVPYRAVLEYEAYSGKKLKEMYIISRKNDTVPNLAEELAALGVENGQLLDRAGISLEDVTEAGFLKSYRNLLKEYPDLAARTKIFVPEFKDVFLMFNFNTLGEQYKVSLEWARDHSPLPLADFLALKKAERKDPDDKHN